MLTDMQLKALKPAEKIYKVSDQHGLYVAVTPTGTASFRFDYRLNSRRETLVIGKYDSTLGMRKPRELDVLDYGMSITLAEARLLLTRAHRSVEQGEKINDAAWLATISANQTPALLSRYRQMFAGEATNIQVLQKVMLMTPENIHLNSFMYEPILDMSDEHLRRLYTRVTELI